MDNLFSVNHKTKYFKYFLLDLCRIPILFFFILTARGHKPFHHCTAGDVTPFLAKFRSDRFSCFDLGLAGFKQRNIQTKQSCIYIYIYVKVVFREINYMLLGLTLFVGYLRLRETCFFFINTYIYNKIMKRKILFLVCFQSSINLFI